MAEKEEGKVEGAKEEAREGAAAEEEEVEVKFRLFDGSDIGPVRCNAAATTVAALKDRVVADWPKDKTIIPKTANDVKLISGGKILENDKNIAQCRAPFGDLPSTAITMHVVVQPSSAKSKPDSSHSLMLNGNLALQFLSPGSSVSVSFGCLTRHAWLLRLPGSFDFRRTMHGPAWSCAYKKTNKLPKTTRCSCSIL